jgi:hypothetical protein
MCASSTRPAATSRSAVRRRRPWIATPAIVADWARMTAEQDLQPVALPRRGIVVLDERPGRQAVLVEPEALHRAPVHEHPRRGLAQRFDTGLVRGEAQRLLRHRRADVAEALDLSPDNAAPDVGVVDRVCRRS